MTLATRVGAVLVLGAMACGGERRAALPARVEIGQPVPGYGARTIGGDSASLAQYRGRVVLLNVWATWCHPCREEIPELSAIHGRYASRGLELIGVSVDASGNDDGIRAFMKEFQMAYPVWHDPDEQVSTRFLLVGVPTTFLIDRGGVLRWRKTGPVQPGDTTLTRAIEAALGG